MELVITEEPSKDSKGKPSTIFYVREKPYLTGFGIQITALNKAGAEWLIKQIKDSSK